MSARQKRSIDARLLAAQVVIDNRLGDAGILAALSAFGYDEAKINAGKGRRYENRRRRRVGQVRPRGRGNELFAAGRGCRLADRVPRPGSAGRRVSEGGPARKSRHGGRLLSADTGDRRASAGRFCYRLTAWSQWVQCWAQ